MSRSCESSLIGKEWNHARPAKSITQDEHTKVRACHSGEDQKLVVPLQEARVSESQSQVWVAGRDERALIRAEAIVAVTMDENGHVTAHLPGVGQHDVPLAAGSAETPIPDDFHRQLIRAVAESADASGAQLIRAHCDDRGWRWVTGPL
ncbi:MAG TPA: hypothetical protein VGP70_05645 [Actinomadura sp.]|nr:hypothetical protein [Actinomadura sp.]